VSGPWSHITLSLLCLATCSASEARNWRTARLRERIRMGGSLVGPLEGRAGSTWAIIS
jgi:hypothetical protein